MTRSTALRDRHRKIIAADQPPCARCGGDIDYTAHHLDPLSFTIDHITPMRGRPELDTLDNLQAMHRKCNREKSDRIEHPGVAFVTERSW